MKQTMFDAQSRVMTNKNKKNKKRTPNHETTNILDGNAGVNIYLCAPTRDPISQFMPKTSAGGRC